PRDDGQPHLGVSPPAGLPHGPVRRRGEGRYATPHPRRRTPFGIQTRIGPTGVALRGGRVRVGEADLLRLPTQHRVRALPADEGQRAGTTQGETLAPLPRARRPGEYGPVRTGGIDGR